MLVLSRKVGEKILLGDDVVVTVLGWQGSRVRIGIAAPDNVGIRRAELALVDPSPFPAVVLPETTLVSGDDRQPLLLT